MKNPISILARIIIPILILFSCHKEHQIITTDKEFPPTVKLIRANIHGVITDYHTGAKLDGIIVELVVEGVVLQRTATFGELIVLTMSKPTKPIHSYAPAREPMRPITPLPYCQKRIAITSHFNLNNIHMRPPTFLINRHYIMQSRINTL